MYSAIALALLSQVSAIGLITIRSGSSVQNSGVKVGSDGSLNIQDGTDFDGTIGDDGSFTFDGKTVSVDSDGFLVLGDAGSNKFAVSDSHLTVDGSSGFTVCVGESGKVGTSAVTCGDGVPVALHVVGDDSSATSAASSEAAATTEAATDAATDAAGSTAVVEETVVETVCTHETCTGVTPANGAIRNVAFGGVAAIAAALL